MKTKINDGLTVRLNFWPQYPKLGEKPHSRRAARNFGGSVTNISTKEKKVFNTAGELLLALEKWNKQKYQHHLKVGKFDVKSIL
jgi:hypothetical protein